MKDRHTVIKKEDFIKTLPIGTRAWIKITTYIFKFLAVRLIKRELVLGLALYPLKKKEVEKKKDNHLTVVGDDE